MSETLSAPVPTAAAQRQINLHNLAAQLIQEASWLNTQKKKDKASSAGIYDKLIASKSTHYTDVMHMILEQSNGEILV